MSDSETEDRPTEVRIPSVWRAMRVLSEAWDMLEANPDLMGEDVVLALESEAPDAMAMMDAIALTIQKKEAFNLARAALIKRIQAQIKRDDDGAESLRNLMGVMMRRLRLPTKRTASGNVITSYRLPSGLVTLSPHDGKWIVTDESKIPDEYWIDVPAERTLDKRKVNAAAASGVLKEGVVQGNSYDTITIRS